MHDLMVSAFEVFLEEIALSWRTLEFAAIGAQYLIPMPVSKMMFELMLFFGTAPTNVALV